MNQRKFETMYYLVFLVPLIFISVFAIMHTHNKLLTFLSCFGLAILYGHWVRIIDKGEIQKW